MSREDWKRGAREMIDTTFDDACKIIAATPTSYETPGTFDCGEDKVIEYARSYLRGKLIKWDDVG